MAGRGAFLAPALVPMASSFVNLPRAFVQAFLTGPTDSVRGADCAIRDALSRLHVLCACIALCSLPVLLRLRLLLLLQRQTGATILELSWETLDGYVQRVCVAWVGGLVKETALRRCASSCATYKARVSLSLTPL